MPKKYLLILFLTLFVFLSRKPFAKAEEGGYFSEETQSLGALNGRNVVPLWNLFYMMPADMPATLGQFHGEFRTGLDIASISEKNRNNVFAIYSDMEVYRPSFNFTFGILEHLDAHLEIPTIAFNDGILDSFTGWYHNHLLGGLGSRDNVANDQFSYGLAQGGNFRYAYRPLGFAISDINLDFKYQLLTDAPGRPAVAVRTGFKFPTGDFNKGAGSGEFDYGFGLLVSKSINRFHFFGGFDAIIIEDPQTLRNLIDGEIFHWYLGSEWVLVKEYLSFILELEFQTTPAIHTGLPQLDNEIFEIYPGFKGSFLNHHLFWQAALREDLIPNSTADYTASFTLGARF